MKRAYALINLNQYKENLTRLKQTLNPNTQIMAIVKADGYGHGAIQIAKAAIEAGATYLGVAWLSEAVQLRSSGITAPILLLSEPIVDFSTEVVGMNITQTIYTKEFVQHLNEKAKVFNRKTKIHLKIDTGMGRIGCQPEEVLPLLEFISSLEFIEIEGIFTHFACADQHESDYTTEQFNIFQQLLKKIEAAGFNIPIKHAANSDATINYPETHLNLVRLGIHSYENVLTLKTHVGFIKKTPKNTKISYGSEYITQQDTLIATIMIGYADGMPRELSNKGRVLINGKSFPIAGKICMDMLMVDIGMDSNVKIGDEVVVIGQQDEESILISEIAKMTNKISYELMCSISKRVPRIYA